ncbi:MAG: hypothetical protein JSU91_06995, partial [Thermoplasmatales archaeon]
METNTEILKKYIKYRQANSKAKKTIEADKTVLLRLLKHTKNKPFNIINENDTQGFIIKQKTLGT